MEMPDISWVTDKQVPTVDPADLKALYKFQADLVASIADLNGDGAADLAAIDNGGVNVAFGNSDGTFQVASTLSTSTPPNVVLTSDINGDGKVDVVLLGDAGAG
jgi:FG-GAP-like repeat